jgi:peptidoglycan/LPS O-acetylase OafA/YrhL
MSVRRAARWTIHLRRRTTTGDWLPEIDGLRFLAISSVLLFHLEGQLEHHFTLAVSPAFAWLIRAFDFGNRGVPLFFVLSGFVLALPFARHHLFATPAPPLRKYFLRRLTRLEPPYLVNLVLVATGVFIADHQSWRALLPHLAASTAYLHYAVFRSPSTINSVAWSLEVEVQFYLLAPLLAAIFALRNPAARRALLVLAMLASALLQLRLGLTQFTLAGDLQFFLAGLLLADFYLVSMPRWPQSRWFDMLSLIGWPCFFLLGDKLSGLWLPWLALLLCLAVFRGVATGRILRTPWIAITGGMCYTIYLWHAPVLTAVGRALRPIAFFSPPSYLPLFALQAAAKIAAVALVCLPLFAFLERPCMDPQWPRKLAARLRPQRRNAPALPADPASPMRVERRPGTAQLR